jgi:hypothetical protein
MMYTPATTPFTTVPPRLDSGGLRYYPSSFVEWLYDLIFGRTSIESHSYLSEASRSSFDQQDATGSLVSMIEPSILGLCEYLGIHLLEGGEVVGYLQRYPGLYMPLLFACHLTDEEFAGEGSFSLEVYHDPEGHDEYLMLTVRQHHYTDDLLGRIERVSDLVRPSLQGESGWLLITTDFQPVGI